MNDILFRAAHVQLRQMRYVMSVLESVSSLINRIHLMQIKLKEGSVVICDLRVRSTARRDSFTLFIWRVFSIACESVDCIWTRLRVKITYAPMD